MLCKVPDCALYLSFSPCIEQAAVCIPWFSCVQKRSQGMDAVEEWVQGNTAHDRLLSLPWSELGMVAYIASAATLHWFSQ